MDRVVHRQDSSIPDLQRSGKKNESVAIRVRSAVFVIALALFGLSVAHSWVWHSPAADTIIMADTLHSDDPSRVVEVEDAARECKDNFPLADYAFIYTSMVCDLVRNGEFLHFDSDAVDTVSFRIPNRYRLPDSCIIVEVVSEEGALAHWVAIRATPLAESPLWPVWDDLPDIAVEQLKNHDVRLRFYSHGEQFRRHYDDIPPNAKVICEVSLPSIEAMMAVHEHGQKEVSK